MHQTVIRGGKAKGSRSNGLASNSGLVPPPPHPQTQPNGTARGVWGGSRLFLGRVPGVPVRDPAAWSRLLFPISCLYFIFPRDAGSAAGSAAPEGEGGNWGRTIPHSVLYTCIHSILSPPCCAVVLFPSVSLNRFFQGFSRLFAWRGCLRVFRFRRPLTRHLSTSFYGLSQRAENNYTT